MIYIIHGLSRGAHLVWGVRQEQTEEKRDLIEYNIDKCKLFGFATKSSLISKLPQNLSSLISLDSYWKYCSLQYLNNSIYIDTSFWV